MKKLIVFLFCIMMMSTIVLGAKPVTKIVSNELYDLDGDGELEEVIVIHESLKETKKLSTISKSFFTEDYSQYLGMELIVNGEVFVDTFVFND